MRAVVFALPGDEAAARRLAEILAAELGQAIVRRFPDGDGGGEGSYVFVKSNVEGKTAIVVAALDQPDAKLPALIFLASTLEESGAERIILVASSLPPDTRRDRRFQAGEENCAAVYFPRLISEWFDALITIDPRRRCGSLGENYSIPSAVLSAARLVPNWIGETARINRSADARRKRATSKINCLRIHEKTPRESRAR
jgi:ribose-phosphate pyrophosphokinase